MAITYTYDSNLFRAFERAEIERAEIKRRAAAEIDVPNNVQETLLPEESVLAAFSSQSTNVVITDKRIITSEGTTVRSIPRRMVRSWSTDKGYANECSLCIQLRHGEDSVVVKRLSREDLIKLDRIIAEYVL